MRCVSPWYNRTSWLGVKLTPAYLLTHTGEEGPRSGQMADHSRAPKNLAWRVCDGVCVCVGGGGGGH